MSDTLEIEILEDISSSEWWGFSAKSLRDQLKGFKGEKIRVPINSYGGSVLEGIAIYNILKGHSAKVETNVVGYAISMGSIILMAGDEITMPEDGYIMIHEPWVASIGDAEEMESTANLLEMMAKDMANIYSQKTGLSQKEIRGMMKKETWLNAKDAKKMGFVDRLTTGAKLAAKFDTSNFINVPESIKGEGQKEVSKKNIESKKENKMNIKSWVKSLFGDANMSDEDFVAKTNEENAQENFIEKLSASFTENVSASLEKQVIALKDNLEKSILAKVGESYVKSDDLENYASKEDVKDFAKSEDVENQVSESVKSLQKNIEDAAKAISELTKQDLPSNSGTDGGAVADLQDGLEKTFDEIELDDLKAAFSN